jgi:hypothetical protein
VPADLAPLIAATTTWLMHAYPADGGALNRALAEAQARQAVTAAAWLRYPTPLDAELVLMAGPGGSDRLDWITGADPVGADDMDACAWRTWVDEAVASWAACLLAEAGLADLAMAALAACPHRTGSPAEFRRLVAPDGRDRQAAVLLRHPDLLAPIADLYGAELRDRLAPGRALTA